MTLVKGDIRLVTNTPASVSQVWVRAPKPRTQGLAYVSESSDTVTVSNGVVEFTALPGAAIMVLVQNGVPTDTVKLLVPDKETASLRECIDAVGLVDDGTMSTLEKLALDVAENVARIGGTAQIDAWVEEAQNSKWGAAREADRSSGEADRSTGEADRAKTEADNSASSAGDSKQDAAKSSSEANRSKDEANRAKSEADRAAQSQNAAATSATNAATSETNAKTSASSSAGFEGNAKAHADRAEQAANETIQQVTGDFATRNYVDTEIQSKAVSYGGFQPATVSVDSLLAGGTNSNSRTYYRMANGGDTPGGGAGVLDVTNSGYAFIQVFYSSTDSTTYHRTITDRSHIVPGQWVFGQWSRAAFDDKTIMLAGDARREAVVEAGLKRRGGVVGTSGKPAIALRFDHYLTKFGQKVLPLLKKYRLPWGQMLNASNVGKGADAWTWEQVAQEAHISGGEVWNHGYTHDDVISEFQADNAVTLGLSTLRDNLPSLWVDSWAPPGQPNYMGFTIQDSPEKFYDTYPGKLVLAQHAFVRGSYPGPHHSLTGKNLIGQSHVTIDSQTAAWCQAAVRSARDTGSGLTMMLHPNYLDQAGYLSTADLDNVLGYIAQLRDAGEIVVLSNAGILMADTDVPVRQTNMLSGAGVGEVTGEWSQSVTSRSYRAHLGVTHEAEAWVKGTGQATLKVEVESPTYPTIAQHQVALGSGAQRMSVAVTPPNDTTKITVTLTGNVRHTGIIYRPI